MVKYRGPILRVTSPALGSDDLTLDQSATSIQILPEPALVTWHVFYKITTLCTVTFGQKVPKLNSRPVYCSRLYGMHQFLLNSVIRIPTGDSCSICSCMQGQQSHFICSHFGHPMCGANLKDSLFAFCFVRIKIWNVTT